LKRENTLTDQFLVAVRAQKELEPYDHPLATWNEIIRTQGI